jgi:hypothetical protein
MDSCVSIEEIAEKIIRKYNKLIRNNWIIKTWYTNFYPTEVSGSHARNFKHT